MVIIEYFYGIIIKEPQSELYKIKQITLSVLLEQLNNGLLVTGPLTFGIRHMEV